MLHKSLIDKYKNFRFFGRHCKTTCNSKQIRKFYVLDLHNTNLNQINGRNILSYSYYFSQI